MTTATAIAADGVGFAYRERQALSDISFEVPMGETHGFLGPNGSGKSTLFKLLSTLVPMQRGTVAVLGHDLRRDIAEIRRLLGSCFSRRRSTGS